MNSILDGEDPTSLSKAHGRLWNTLKLIRGAVEDPSVRQRLEAQLELLLVNFEYYAPELLGQHWYLLGCILDKLLENHFEAWATRVVDIYMDKEEENGHVRPSTRDINGVMQAILNVAEEGGLKDALYRQFMKLTIRISSTQPRLMWCRWKTLIEILVQTLGDRPDAWIKLIQKIIAAQVDYRDYLPKTQN